MAVESLSITTIYLVVAVAAGYCVVRVARRIRNPFIQLTILAASAVALWYFLVVLLLPQLGLSALYL